MILVKIHENKGSEIIAVCDSDLLGKKFTEGKLHIDVNENFYKGKEMPRKSIIRILKACKNANIVGKESMKLALENSIIEETSIIRIKGVPIALLVKL